ncbi:DinB family protein [Paenibacillus sp. GP183]|uniref:DinB family protein n=1 Tax=Paenibacillus sp. GP183 TaxID=1882751 RepID=UPI000899335D|nr:DinB family protein [Paenibacillus sp. GP183]SEB72824.1 DinB superfamily protein [Paenibacillus sp. GP183]
MTNKLFVDYENAILEVLKLKEIPESSLLKPIQEGKWSVREIIGHLFYWDKFILDHLVPHITNNAVLPPFPDFDLHNQDAIKYIERYNSVVSLIDEFSQTRKQVIEKMFGIKNNIKFTIGTDNFTKDSFITVFIEHDTHHFKQIWDHLSLE